MTHWMSKRTNGPLKDRRISLNVYNYGPKLWLIADKPVCVIYFYDAAGEGSIELRYDSESDRDADLAELDELTGVKR